jgi:hypothetical protein
MLLENLVDKDGRPLTEIWPQVRLFQDVQDILDRNRLLIAEINHNHQLGTNVALERNVPMLRELNSNIGRVVQSYKEAADSFVTALFPATSQADAQQHAAAQQMQEGLVPGQPQAHPPQQPHCNQTQQTADPSSVQQP